jgi:hypothetical protein
MSHSTQIISAARGIPGWSLTEFRLTLMKFAAKRVLLMELFAAGCCSHIEGLWLTGVDAVKLHHAGSSTLERAWLRRLGNTVYSSEQTEQQRRFCFSATSGAAEHRSLRRVRAGLRAAKRSSKPSRVASSAESEAEQANTHQKDNNHLRSFGRRVGERPVAGEKRRDSG